MENEIAQLPWDSAQINQLADEVSEESGDWVEFYSKVFGLGGIVYTMVPQWGMPRFVQSDCYDSLLRRLASKRSETGSTNASPYESMQMITIRVPESLHAVLSSEANDANTSIQQVAITKLVLMADPRFLPIFSHQRRGRRPGSQSKPKTNENC